MSEWGSMEISTICNGDRTKFRTDDPVVMPSATFLVSYSNVIHQTTYSRKSHNSPEVLTHLCIGSAILDPFGNGDGSAP